MFLGHLAVQFMATSSGLEKYIRELGVTQMICYA